MAAQTVSNGNTSVDAVTMKQLQKYHMIAKQAVEEKEKMKRQLQGLENFTKLTKEMQQETQKQREKVKWVEITLLRKEAELIRTKSKLDHREKECVKLKEVIENLKSKGISIPDGDEGSTRMLDDQEVDGKSLQGNRKENQPEVHPSDSALSADKDSKILNEDMKSLNISSESVRTKVSKDVSDGGSSETENQNEDATETDETKLGVDVIPLKEKRNSVDSGVSGCSKEPRTTDLSVTDVSDGVSVLSQDGTTDVSDGKTGEASTRRKKQNLTSASPKGIRKPKMLAPSFEVGVSQDLYEQVVQQLTKVSSEMNKLLDKNGVSITEYAKSSKFQALFEKQKQICESKDKEVEKLKEELKMKDKDGEIANLKEEIAKLRQSDELKNITIQAANRQYQDQKIKLNELYEKQRIQSQRQGNPLKMELAKKMQTDFSYESSDDEDEDIPPESIKTLKYQRDKLKKNLDDMTLEKSQIMQEKSDAITQRDDIQRQFDNLKAIYERSQIPAEDVIKSRCQQCEKYMEQIERLQQHVKKLETDVITTTGQMKIFEEDYRRVERKIQVDEQNYKREIDGWMRNCQSLSIQLDKVTEEKQRIQDHTQALEYQLSIVQEYMRDHRPIYSVESHPVARTGTGTVDNPGASLWQEGYREERYHPDHYQRAARYGYGDSLHHGGYHGGYPSHTAQLVGDFPDGGIMADAVSSNHDSTEPRKTTSGSADRSLFQSSVDISHMVDDSQPPTAGKASDDVLLCCPGCGIMLPEDRQEESQSHINSCIKE